MKKCVLSVFFSLVSVFLLASFASAKTVTAVTEDGREVILYDDGTYEFSVTAKKGVRTQQEYSKPPTSKQIIKGKKEKYAIWYDEKKWKNNSDTLSKDSSAELKLEHISGDGNALVIYERIQMPIDALKGAAIDNAKQAAPDAKVVFEETRTVNGKTVLCMRIDGTIKQIPFTYYSYYYAGKAGAIQFITYTGQNLFEELKKDFTDLLNGIEISE